MARRRDRMIRRLRDRVEVSDRVVGALRRVPRDEFVPDARADQAHIDRPLPIGEGQTISAPHMVALIADRLDATAGDRVLEVGTGCGYHAAVTAELVGAKRVYTVERSPTLADRAREHLAETSYGAVSVRTGDGRAGWPEHAPYDRAYLTCAAEAFPAGVCEQVRPGGIVLGPIGDRRQRLIGGRVRPDGSLDRTDHGPVRFVRLR